MDVENASLKELRGAVERVHAMRTGGASLKDACAAARITMDEYHDIRRRIKDAEDETL